MLLLLLFAFLAGIFTVLSPCILPILPAILSAGTAEGKWRPAGIILGLIASFTFFTLTLTAIVHITGLSATALRSVAIVLIFFFGLVMIFPRLSNWFAKFTAPLANFGQSIQDAKQPNGFWSGFVFGCALGLLWTPCAGPILAAITTLVATHAVDIGTILLTLAYSIGAGIPMFLIAYGSNRIIHSSKYLSQHTQRIRQFFGGIMIFVALALIFNWDMLLTQKFSNYSPQIFNENNEHVEKELRKIRKPKIDNYGQAPEIRGIDEWINSSPLSLSDLKGKVVLLDFWTYSCINCIRTLPYIEKLYEDYKDKGLVVIGIHTPEFEFEKNPANVAAAVKRLGITYPVALDNEYKTWEAYNNTYWPTHYLINQDGIICMEHSGEGGYVATENAVRKLLGLAPLSKSEPRKSSRLMSSETYLGSAKGTSYIPEITLHPKKTQNYSYAGTLGPDQVGLRGKWLVDSNFIAPKGNNSYVDINFLATNVYLVLSGSSKTPLEVSLDGYVLKEIPVNGDKKYDIIKTSYKRHLLSIKVPPGVKVYAFTFGVDE